MEEVKVHEGKGRHRLDDGYGTQGDTWVVAPRDREGGGGAISAAGRLLATDGGGGLEGRAEGEWCTRADATEEASAVVRLLYDSPCFGGNEGIVGR